MKVTGWKIQVNMTKVSHLKLVGPDLESVDLKCCKSSQFNIKTARVTSSKPFSDSLLIKWTETGEFCVRSL